jgi:hypothetical protein
VTFEELKNKNYTAIESANDDQIWAMQLHSSICFLANKNYSNYATFDEAWDAAEQEVLEQVFENEQ